MRITSKGQVTIPQAIGNAADLLPNTDVEIVYKKGEVLLRPTRHDTSATFAATLKGARRSADHNVSRKISRRDYGISARRMAIKPALLDSCVIIDLFADESG